MKSILIRFFVLAAMVSAAICFIEKRNGSAEHSKNLLTRTAHLSKDAISVVKSAYPTKSYFGGTPPASARFVWPTREGRSLSFLACIDCSELPKSADLDWLPDSGLLLFFYDIQNQPWGFDPKDRNGSATLYIPATEVSDRSSFANPTTPLPADSVLPKRFVVFHLSNLPPSWESSELKTVGFTDTEMDQFIEQREALYRGQAHHQIGGFADPVQNPDMDEECQLATQGLYCGDSTSYKDPRVAKAKEGTKDWSLLFQMDSDEELKVMWGDVGMIYFWVRRDDARKRKFDNVWVILQCG